jgi:hypothetical protein
MWAHPNCPCLISRGAAWVSTFRHQSQAKEKHMLIEILVILAIIVLALFIWRNMVGRRV